MRILVDSMCAQFGGIRTYAEHLLRAWPAAYGHDELHVLVEEGSTLPIPDGVNVHRAALRGPRLLSRPWAQTRVLPRLAADLNADAVLAMLPSTSLQTCPAPTAVVIYDLRHELRPDQFGKVQRMMRSLSYAHGYRLADGFVSISQRSLDDLHSLHPELATKPSIVAHLGGDHVDGWHGSEDKPYSLAFAHHSNKNLDLVLAGWAELLKRRPHQRLKVLGLGDEMRSALEAELAARGMTSAVELAPFLPADAFAAAFAGAELILFPSDFEGFGLPVAEAMRLGIPVVIGPERATQEVAGGHAVVMESWSPMALAAAVERGLDQTTEVTAAAKTFAARYTWSETVRQTRTLLETLTRTAPQATA